jgi:hypothetical protein
MGLIGGLLIVAIAAGLSMFFSKNIEPFIDRLEARGDRRNPQPLPERIVFAERPEYDPAAAESMKLL